MKTYGWAWHVHHDILYEPLVEPIEARVTYILREKPTEEIETRLRLLRPVRGTISTSVLRAWQLHIDGSPYNYSTIARGDEAWLAYGNARRTPEAVTYMAALHEQECPECPWDGETIFPGVPDEGNYGS